MHSWRRLFVHLVWGTWNRFPMLTDANERIIFGTITKQAQRLRSEVLAIGGVSDHIHALVSLSPQTSVTTLLRAIKSASTVEVHRSIQAETPFKWQHGYAALSVWPDESPAVITYIKNQKRHHAERTLEPQWEPPLDELDVDD